MPKWLGSLVEAAGVEGREVPKALGTLAALKYGTLTAAVVLGVRVQPLRRVLLQRRQVYPERAISPLQRPGAWAHLQKHQPKRPAVRCTHSVAEGSHLQMLPQQQASGARNDRSQLRRLLTAARGRYSGGRLARTLITARLQWLRHRQLQQQQQLLAGQRRSAQLTWHAWISKKYWQLADKTEQAVGSSRLCQLLASWGRFDPKRLAVGVAEGAILYKSTIWLHLPLHLWIVLVLFRQR